MLRNYHNIPRYIREPICYFLVGGLTTIVQYGVYLLLNLWIYTWLAFSIGYGINLILNYWLHNKVTFKTTPCIVNGIGYAISKVINYFVQISLLHLFLWLGCSDIIAPIPIFIIAGCINYLILKFCFQKVKMR